MTLFSDIFISLGSNKGERYENCLSAICKVKSLKGSRVLEVSKFYLTQPTDFLDQDSFINGVFKMETSLKPLELLSCLQTIQKEMGQGKKEIRFGPRIIDLDIIFFGNQVMDDKELTIPHPRMHKRSFVLTPLCDIGARIMHPVLDETVSTLLDWIKTDPEQGVKEYTGHGIEHR